MDTYAAPPADRSKVQVQISPSSDRLQVLKPFAKWDGKDGKDMPILIKSLGKTTTDHISMAGPWLKYRGHLQNISNNYMIGAINAENEEANNVKNQITGEWNTVPETAISYRDAGIRWVVVGGDNFGEGSSREHAALEPRFLGGFAIIASLCSYPRDQLEEAGSSPLNFKDGADYDKINPSDRIDIVGLADLAPGKPVKYVVHPKDGASWESELTHTFNAEQLDWFKAGSALNRMKELNKRFVWLMFKLKSCYLFLTYF